MVFRLETGLKIKHETDYFVRTKWNTVSHLRSSRHIHNKILTWVTEEQDANNSLGMTVKLIN